MRDQERPEARGSNYHVRALDRALDILDAFNLSRPELSLTDISTIVDLPISTTKRLAFALEERGYLERSPDTEHYRIGVRVFEIGSVYIQTTTIEAEARPILDWLAHQCNQTANLGILSRGEVVHIAVVPPDRPIRYFATVGEREKATYTGLGKALISEFSDDELAALVARHSFVPRTRRTITSLALLKMHLEEVRARGYAMDDEESVVGVRCVAAPIRNDKGAIVASVSISGPAFEFSEQTLPSHIDAVKRAALDISLRLGFAVRPPDDKALEERGAVAAVDNVTE